MGEKSNSHWLRGQKTGQSSYKSGSASFQKRNENSEQKYGQTEEKAPHQVQTSEYSREKEEGSETVAIAFPEDSQLKLKFVQYTKYGDRVYVVVEDKEGKAVNRFYLDIPNAAELLKILARFVMRSKGEKYLVAVIRKVVNLPEQGASSQPQDKREDIMYVPLGEITELKKKIDDLEATTSGLVNKVGGLSSKVENFEKVIGAIAKTLGLKET